VKQADRSRRVSRADLPPSVLWHNRQTEACLVLRPKPRNRCGDFEAQITKPIGFEAKSRETVATNFKAKLEKIVATSFKAKSEKIVAAGFETKPLEIIAIGFEAQTDEKPSE
jgi:hypothetical protein